MAIPTSRTCTDQSAGFLERFSLFENNKKPQPKSLSPEEHAEFRKHAKSVQYVRPKLSEGTQNNLGVILTKWKCFCKELLDTKDWETVIKTIEVPTMIDFLLYICESDSVKAQALLTQYFRRFQQLYRIQTGNHVDRNDSELVYKYMHAILIPTFNLCPPNTNKPVLEMEALHCILTFHLAYDYAIQPLERQRVQLSACYQVFCYPGVRPAELDCNEPKKSKDGTVEEIFGVNGVSSICTDSRPMDSARHEGVDESRGDQQGEDQESLVLSRLLLQETVARGRPKALCYEDILLMIVHDPESGQLIPAMAIKFVHHKGCDNKPRPLVDASSVLNVKPCGGMQCIQLRWKESMLKKPVFRRVKSAELSDDERMAYAKLRDDMGEQSLNAGFKERWTPKFCRRRAGNAVNGDTLDSIRDQMIRHDPRFATSRGAYQN
ncbi:Uu.00g136620.m01.CDS01 [Anthostomella pinea]|uniref:Uu.00g136620.m01.CDS01 n=1 Tax=Anthostomella pinea TaxID=933095 RepID=A0AAI8VQJ8_9PEZI|nr:Uu.00g136620.m01.CDS01 [Anthostomella pinea]